VITLEARIGEVGADAGRPIPKHVAVPVPA
jgi:hypothetical protein